MKNELRSIYNGDSETPPAVIEAECSRVERGTRQLRLESAGEVHDHRSHVEHLVPAGAGV